MDKIRIGTRESRLAMVQAQIVADHLKQTCPGLETELVPMKTTGDRVLNQPLDRIGGKGLFVKELDQALLEGRTDLSVHSLKDMPMEVPEELPVIGYSRREDPRDVLVLPQGADYMWDITRPVGCSSRRRILQLSALYPGITFENVRGNVLTRLKKLDEGQYGALVLAAAGLKRLGLEHRISRYFEPEEMIPAAGQGILALQGRAGEDLRVLDSFLDPDSETCAICERAFVRRLVGGCSSPAAAHARIFDDRILLLGLFCDENTGHYATGNAVGHRDEAEKLGEYLADQLRSSICGKEQP